MTALRLRFVLPLGVFAALTLTLAVYLYQIQFQGRVVSNIPSALIDKPVPEFDLPPVRGNDTGLSSVDLGGKVTLVNFFASWCVACKVEHPLLNRLTTDDVVPVYGINYKDKPADARRWLDEFGDPYRRSGADLDGRVGIDWGVYGLPETFVVDRAGRIVYKHIGPINQRDWEEKIQPLVNRLRR